MIFFVLTLVTGYKTLDNSFWILHDNLNSEVIFKSLPVEENVFFNLSTDAMVKGYIGDIPRCSYPSSPFSIISWLFFLFPASWAMLMVAVIGRCIAFFGMYYLIKYKSEISFPSPFNTICFFCLAFGFAFLPVLTIHGWTIQGLPFLLICLYKLKESPKSIGYFIGVLLYGLSGSFVLGGFAVLGLVFCFSAYSVFVKANFSRTFIMAFCLLALGLVLSDIQLFVQFLFDQDFQSHRSFWQPKSNWTLKVVLYDLYAMLCFGHYHSPSMQLPLLMALMAFCFLGWRKLKLSNEFYLILTLILFIALFHGIYKSEIFAPVKRSIKIFSSFQFDRFYFLNSVLWILLFVSFCKQNIYGDKRKSLLGLMASLFFAVYSFSGNEEVLSNIKGSAVSQDVECWNNFYFTGIQDEIDEFFPDKKNFKVIHLGVDPSVGCMLGFRTVDGYHTNYPNQLKDNFKALIKLDSLPESKQKNSILNWGSKLKYVPSEDDLFDLDWGLARKMKILYVVSNKKIKDQEHLYFAHFFYDAIYDQSLYFYRIGY